MRGLMYVTGNSNRYQDKVLNEIGLDSPMAMAHLKGFNKLKSYQKFALKGVWGQRDPSRSTIKTVS